MVASRARTARLAARAAPALRHAANDSSGALASRGARWQRTDAHQESPAVFHCRRGRAGLWLWLLEPAVQVGPRASVRPAKAGAFRGRQSPQGKSQEPCSLDGRQEGEPSDLKPIDGSHLRDGEQVTGP
jgi:hypothetical protein